eukprot:72767-Chlamydomonas_euryale.AAC.1
MSKRPLAGDRMAPSDDVHHAVPLTHLGHGPCRGLLSHAVWARVGRVAVKAAWIRHKVEVTTEKHPTTLSLQQRLDAFCDTRDGDFALELLVVLQNFSCLQSCDLTLPSQIS